MTNEEAIMILKAMIDEMILVFDRDRKKALNMAIKALMEQSKHDQNTPQKQPDPNTLGIKTEESCEDVISRQDAIDAVEFGITYVKVLNKENGEVMELFKKSNEELQKAVNRIEALPSVQPEIIHCKECKYAHMTYDGDCKYCDVWFPDESKYVGGDYYCASAERKTDE